MTIANLHRTPAAWRYGGDLMLAACGIRYLEASSDVSSVEIRGVPIPFANPQLLLRMKQTHREKDAEDRVFLQRKIAESSRPNE